MFFNRIGLIFAFRKKIRHYVFYYSCNHQTSIGWRIHIIAPFRKCKMPLLDSKILAAKKNWQKYLGLNFNNFNVEPTWTHRHCRQSAWRSSWRANPCGRAIQPSRSQRLSPAAHSLRVSVPWLGLPEATRSWRFALHHGYEFLGWFLSSGISFFHFQNAHFPDVLNLWFQCFVEI